jgi:hypothetical protein
MSYYLKYLKYKQKYLDLKNLDLFSGISLGNYNYKDLEGGVLGTRSVPLRGTLVPLGPYETENPFLVENEFLEDIANHWCDNVSITSFSPPISKDGAATNEKEDISKKEAQDGYYLNYEKKKINGNTYSYEYNDHDSHHSHIHIINAIDRKTNFEITYILKINFEYYKIPEDVMSAIRQTTRSDQDIINILGEYIHVNGIHNLKTLDFIQRIHRFNYTELTEVIEELKLQGRIAILLLPYVQAQERKQMQERKQKREREQEREQEQERERERERKERERIRERAALGEPERIKKAQEREQKQIEQDRAALQLAIQNNSRLKKVLFDDD